MGFPESLLPAVAQPSALAPSNSPAAPDLVVRSSPPPRSEVLWPQSSPQAAVVGVGWEMEGRASFAIPQQALQGWSGFLFLN